jgi:hypothetical protein
VPPYFGIADRIFREEGFGFIPIDDGEPVYFDRNALKEGLDIDRRRTTRQSSSGAAEVANRIYLESVRKCGADERTREQPLAAKRSPSFAWPRTADLRATSSLARSAGSAKGCHDGGRSGADDPIREQPLAAMR